MNYFKTLGIKLGKNTATCKKIFTNIETPLYFIAVPLWSPEGHIRAETRVGLKVWTTLLNSCLL